MDNEGLTTGDAFAQFIMTEWLETTKVGEQVRCNAIGKNYKENTYRDFIVRLMQIWRQLAPNMKNRKMRKYPELADKTNTKKDSPESEKGYFYFEKYAIDESKMIQIADSTTRSEELYKLETCLRYTLEELGITSWQE